MLISMDPLDPFDYDYRGTGAIQQRAYGTSRAAK
jgi:hypothetical protein